MKDKSSPSVTPTNDAPNEEAEVVDHAEGIETTEKMQPYMIMPYAGKQGEKIMSKITKKMPDEARPRIVYKGTKLSTFFSAKDKVEKEHCSDIIYYYKSKWVQSAW